MRDSRRQHVPAAFSLLELVVVMAILTVVTAIAVPRFTAASTRYQADQAVRQIVADLTLARRHAKATGASQTVTFSVATDQYTMPSLSDLKSAAGDYTVTLSESPYRAKIVTAAFGNDAAIIFDAWGRPDSGGGVTITVGGETRSILVDAETGEAAAQ